MLIWFKPTVILWFNQPQLTRWIYVYINRMWSRCIWIRVGSNISPHNSKSRPSVFTSTPVPFLLISHCNDCKIITIKVLCFIFVAKFMIKTSQQIILVVPSVQGLQVHPLITQRRSKRETCALKP